jgi:uncharacterized protein YndB with AHSA1/START domain
MSVADVTTLRLERTMDAPAQDVFDAWTSPEVLRRWWAVDPSYRVPVAEVDLRVGGAYRLTMERPDGSTHTVQGEYREVSPPERLVFTWAWVEEDGSIGHVSTVTVTFRGAGTRTTVVIEHAGLPTAESRERHSAGWTACLTNLAQRVFAPAGDAA